MKKSSRPALTFVLLLGAVSLFADVTYEGARSITGPYLQLLGATATVVGIVAGLGELIGYSLRLLSGFIAERTKRYWAITFFGYFVNLLSIPLMGFVHRWEWLALLMLLERLGKAIRTPARDTMLSHATSQTGHGWGFGLHEFLDQLGAVSGPLAIAWLLYKQNGYAFSFRLLGVSAIVALLILFAAFLRYPKPENLETERVELQTARLSPRYWWYIVATFFLAAGYVDFPLIAYHLQKTAHASAVSIPLLYSLAMASDAVAALLFGRWFDAKGMVVLSVAAALSMAFAPLVFWGSLRLVTLGAILWGVGMGAQESILRAGIAKLVPAGRRASAYGIFNTGYGIAWFIGSSLMGVLYDLSLTALVSFSIATQVVAVLLFAPLGIGTGMREESI